MTRTCPSGGELLLLAERLTRDSSGTVPPTTPAGAARSNEEADEGTDSSAARDTAAHVEVCEECARKLAFIREALALIRSGAAAPGPTSRSKQPTPCEHEQATLRYADGALREESTSDVEAHIARCPTCFELLADLWDTTTPKSAPPAGIEERVLGALAAERRTAVVGWREGMLTLQRSFGTVVSEMADALAGTPVVPAHASARGRPSVALSWTEGEELTVELEIREVSGRPSLLGRLDADDRVVRAVSAALAGAASARGPESLDARGRFGPWALEEGSNALTLTGGPLPGGRVTLTIELEA